jgi:hypothetical protein
MSKGFKERKKYNEQFWTFWKQEIPNVIQILTLPSFFGVLIKNYFFDLALFILTIVLLANYTSSKMTEFISEKYPLPNHLSHSNLSKSLDSRWNLITYGFSNRNNLIMATVLTIVTASIVILARITLF